MNITRTQVHTTTQGQILTPIQKVTARHITSHGYSCVIHRDKMYILMPVWNYKTGCLSHSILRVTSLKDAFIKMGY